MSTKNGGLAMYPNKIGPVIFKIGRKHGVSAGEEHRYIPLHMRDQIKWHSCGETQIVVIGSAVSS